MSNIKEVLENIKEGDIIKNDINVPTFFLKEFGLDEYSILEQKEENVRLTYYQYKVYDVDSIKFGIRIWFFDNKPVCLSLDSLDNISSFLHWKEYGTYLYWFGEGDYKKVRAYIHSLYKEKHKEYFVLWEYDDDEYLDFIETALQKDIDTLKNI